MERILKLGMIRLGNAWDGDLLESSSLDVTRGLLAKK